MAENVRMKVPGSIPGLAGQALALEHTIYALLQAFTPRQRKAVLEQLYPTIQILETLQENNPTSRTLKKASLEQIRKIRSVLDG